MATPEGYGGRERTGGSTRLTDPALWRAPATWFAAGAVGLMIVFIGLGIDAWRHNNGAGEESLLSWSNPGHVVAGIGLLLAAVAMLGGLSVTLLQGTATADAAIRRFVPVTAAWVTMAAVAIGAITYIGSTGVTVGHGGHDDETSVAAQDEGSGGEEAGIVTALEDSGINPSGTDANPENVRGALTQGASGHPDGKHDHGQHATFTELRTMSDEDVLSTFPDGLVSAEQLPLLKDQLAASRRVAEELNTVEKAAAAGFRQTTNDVPFMGEHWLNMAYVTDGVFDPAKPEGLLFSTIDGERKLVGVWHLLIPGLNKGLTREVEPEGFAGDLDLWHAHLGLCIVALEGASEGETKESCDAKGGRFTADLRWMMHVWVAPEATENADGFFAYLNGDLFEKQQAAQQADGDDTPSGVVGD